MTSRARLLLTQGFGGASAALLLVQGFLAPIETPTPPLVHHAAVSGASTTRLLPDGPLQDLLKRANRDAKKRRRKEEELLLLLMP